MLVDIGGSRFYEYGLIYWRVWVGEGKSSKACWGISTSIYVYWAHDSGGRAVVTKTTEWPTVTAVWCFVEDKVLNFQMFWKVKTLYKCEVCLDTSLKRGGIMGKKSARYKQTRYRPDCLRKVRKWIKWTSHRSADADHLPGSDQFLTFQMMKTAFFFNTKDNLI